jgi:hypothetical protein
MRHFWLRDHVGFPMACIASTLQPDSSIAFAIAITNPKDTFNRQRGREIAEGRLTKGTSRTLPLPSDKPAKHYILSDVAADTGLPGKVRAAAFHWLTKHPLDPAFVPYRNRSTVEAIPAPSLGEAEALPPMDFAAPTEAPMEAIAAPPEPSESEIEITVAPSDSEALNRIFTGVHEREERPFSFGDAPDETEAWNNLDA